MSTYEVRLKYYRGANTIQFYTGKIAISGNWVLLVDEDTMMHGSNIYQIKPPNNE